MKKFEENETEYGYYTIGEYDAREETDNYGRKFSSQENFKNGILEGIINTIGDIWQSSPGKLLGVLLGLFIGICIVIFGFFTVFFVLLCGAVGLFIGANFDKGGDLLRNIRMSMPNDWHRWR